MRPIVLLAAAMAIAPVWPVSAAAPEHAQERAPAVRATAAFAGGCFWCMQAAFDGVPGILATTAGYTGGHVDHPTYEQVSAGGTGHRESVQVTFDPRVISYQKLLDLYWHNIDPTDDGGQFCDRGSQYTSAIFVADAAQREAAERSKRMLERTKPFKGAVVTEILPATTFWPAEAYHQEYARKHPLRYRYYRWGCGRDQRLEALWGDAAGHD